MRTAKVLVTDLSGVGNKIHHSGDKVSEASFPEGHFDQLIEGGFIKETTGEEGAEPDAPASEEASSEETPAQPEAVVAEEAPAAEDNKSGKSKSGKK
jgi:hypothetical protein